MVAFALDTSTDYGKRVARRLQDETIVWLTTTNKDGTPEPSPVWFTWDGQSVLVYSLRGTSRERNIRRNAKVALHFDSNGQGGDIVVISGEAAFAEDEPAAHAHPTYAAKYRDGFTRIGVTAEQFSMRYSLPIRVRPTKLRGF
jgi:PPOX class probable F420-dependent enzyme